MMNLTTYVECSVCNKLIDKQRSIQLDTQRNNYKYVYFCSKKCYEQNNILRNNSLKDIDYHFWILACILAIIFMLFCLWKLVA